MLDIDFQHIRPSHDGARHAFEELVCQIARRNPPKGAQEFRRIEGAGGDGGVEAYWLRQDGKKTGYQAKYHLKSADIDWAAIDNSVRTALDKHPELYCYVVAIPCDLTDRTGKSAKGKTGWEHWETHKVEWLKWAAAKGRSVTFEPWTKHELSGFLNNPTNAGLAQYWFDLPRFNAAWFDKHLQSAVADLDERYHPEDHVEVRLEEVFDGLKRHRRLREKIADAVPALRRAFDDFEQSLSRCPATPPEEPLRSLREVMRDVDGISAAASAHPATLWPVDLWRRLLRKAKAPQKELDKWIWGMPGNPGEQDYKVISTRRDLRELGKIFSKLEKIIFSNQLSSDDARALLLTGTAGSGKSHLLAAVAQSSLAEGTPVLLLLGQHFQQGEPWTQILARLDLAGYTRDQLLGALNAAAEWAGTRALILIDALNEGAGLTLWRDRLAGFLEDIRRYPNIAVAVSCRSEYRDRLIPEKLRDRLVVIVHEGFSTPEEQDRAARQYLEKRGIIRPAVPWLAPEFINPLFLRACCVSLAKQGKTEFPRGLRGVKAILAFYLDNVGRHLDPAHAGTDGLVAPLRCALAALAGKMAEERRDFIHLSGAGAIIKTAFDVFAAQLGRTWLEVLQGAGLLRRDPDPAPEDEFRTEDVIRFAFQRFSDHFIAEALLKGVSDPAAALSPSGALDFLLDEHGVRWEWRGVADALAIQLPETRGVELVDVLPGGFNRWWDDWAIIEGWKQSVLWRASTALTERAPRPFTERTRELLNELPSYEGEGDPRFDLLIQLAVVAGHPWNADFLDRDLSSRPLPERDALWSIAHADATDDMEHSIHGLIDWAWHADKTRADDETLWLTALTLTWCFSASSRPIRDRATKALSAVLWARRGLFPRLVEHFATVDDAYVTERLFAAGYGAACARPPQDALAAWARATYDFGFKDGKPPVHLLTRDYMLGIVEAASAFGALPLDIDLARCKPPFATDWPLDDVTEEEVEKIVERAEDKAILRSAGDWGDFGRYEIEPGVRYFTMTPLSDPAPLDGAGKLRRFVALVIGDDPDRQACLRRLREAVDKLRSATLIFRLPLFDIEEKTESEAAPAVDITALEAEIDAAESALLALLSTEELKLYEELAAPILCPDHNEGPDQGVPKVDIPWARNWVTKRAYELGWTKQRFPREPTDYSSTHRPNIERISKKYQWIALYELLARLSDHCWIESWGGDPIVYANPCDLGIQRDIDPTLFVRDRDPNRGKDGPAWWLPRPATLPPVSDVELLDWPFRDDEVINGPELIDVTDPQGGRWLVLHSFFIVREKGEGRNESSLDRRDQFTRVCPLIVRAEDAGRATAAFEGKHLSNSMDWAPPEITDEGYLFEAPWRATWRKGDWESSEEWGNPADAPVVFPLFEYRWESHLDAALPNGARVHLPVPWLAAQMKLRPRRLAPGQYEDDAGRLIFFDPEYGGKGGGAAVIARDVFLQFLRDNGLACLWLVGGERNAWSDGSINWWTCRYHSGIYRWSDNGWVEKRWHDDVRTDRRLHQ